MGFSLKFPIIHTHFEKKHFSKIKILMIFFFFRMIFL